MEKLVLDILQGGSLLLLFVVMLVIGKIINDIFTPYNLDDQLTDKDNVAVATSLSGYFIAITIVFIGAMLGETKGIIEDLKSVGLYSLLGIFLLNISHIINDKLILYKFSNVKELVEDRNSGTGAVQFGSYVASGLIIAGAVHGEGGGIITALAFYAIAQVVLILFTFIYNFITPYDVHDEIERDNVAAGVAFGGALIALGIILMKGASGNFKGWIENLTVFGQDALLIIVLLPIIRFFFDKIIIPKSSLSHEIKVDRNIGAAFLEATVMIGFSVVLMYTLG